MPEWLVEWTPGWHHTSGDYTVIAITNDAGKIVYEDTYMGPPSWCAIGEAVGDALGRGEEAIEEHITWCIGLHKELRDG